PVDGIAGDYRVKRAATPHSHKEPAALGHILGGAPCARMSGGAGLAGVVVIDHQGRPGILSNWHVLAGPSAQKGDPIVTLRRSQGALHRHRIGGLSQWTLGKVGDAAIALLDPSVPWLPIQHHSFEHPRALRRARLGEVLTKHSQSSGTTQARVDGVGSYRLSYETSPGNWEDKHIDGIKLVALNPASPGDGAALRPGDSGAVWMHSANQDVAGLQFASDMSPGTSCEQLIACHLDSVLDQLNARLADFDDFVAAGQFGFPKELGQSANLTHPQEWADLWGAQASIPSLADAVLDTPQSGPVADCSTHPELASSQSHRDNIDAIWQGLRAALSPAELCAQGASLSSTYASGHHAAQIAQIINDPAQGFGLRRPVEEDEIGMFNTFFDLCWLIDAIRRGII
ncbi:MAG: hypothetical protein OIF40_00020, partial [Mangrovicoccus sp.]|nr:hypothetical protein [Mangrovicoccus sp.]